MHGFEHGSVKVGGFWCSKSALKYSRFWDDVGFFLPKPMGLYIAFWFSIFYIEKLMEIIIEQN